MLFLILLLFINIINSTSPELCIANYGIRGCIDNTEICCYKTSCYSEYNQNIQFERNWPPNPDNCFHQVFLIN